MKRSKAIVAAAVLCGLGLQASSAMATFIPNAIQTATATSYQQGDNPTPGDGSVIRVVNGAGLTVGDPNNATTWVSDNAWQNGWQGQTQVTPAAPGWFIIDLGATYTNLQNMYIWNVTEVAARGTQQADIFYSTSPTVPVPATGTPTYNFSSGGWTNLATGITIAQAATNGTDQYNYLQSLSSVAGARYIGIQMDSKSLRHPVSWRQPLADCYSVGGDVPSDRRVLLISSI